MVRLRPILAAFALALAPAAPPAAGADTDQAERSGAQRYRACMLVGVACGRRVEEGDIPYAWFKARGGRRPRVRVCVRDRDGRYCLPPRRPRRNGVLTQPVLYKNTGPQMTTWRVDGKVVGRWRWRVVPE